MESLFTLKDSKHNFHLIAFQFHTLDYSVGVLKNKKKELKENPILKHKLDNYLLMQRLAFGQKSNGDVLPFNMEDTMKQYLNSPENKDLRTYMNICQHIVARELDMAELCSKIDFDNHLFILEGKDLYCTDCNLSTATGLYNDIEKDFLCSCAKRGRRIVRTNSGATNVQTLYHTNKDLNNNLMRVA